MFHHLTYFHCLNADFGGHQDFGHSSGGDSYSQHGGGGDSYGGGKCLIN